MFKTYNLYDLQLPDEAFPQGDKNTGQHGYTLTASNGAVASLSIKGFEIIVQVVS